MALEHRPLPRTACTLCVYVHHVYPSVRAPMHARLSACARAHAVEACTKAFIVLLFFAVRSACAVMLSEPCFEREECDCDGTRARSVALR